MAMKQGVEIPTIDVAMVTITTTGTNPKELALKTSNKVEVEPATETQDAVKNIVKGVLIAQKPAKTIITGNALTLTDNVFNPQLVKILQGGTIYYWQESTHETKGETETAYGVAGYKPPAVGSTDSGEIFTLNLYSAIYNAAGLVTGYEKCSYPNCQGQPVAFGSEDNVFRAPQYTITSAPDTGESPYEIEYVEALPSLETFTVTQTLTEVTSSFSDTEVNMGAHLSITLTPTSGYTLGDPTVTMGGTDITASAWNSTNNTITINGVTGNIVITATATE